VASQPRPTGAGRARPCMRAGFCPRPCARATLAALERRCQLEFPEVALPGDPRRRSSTRGIVGSQRRRIRRKTVDRRARRWRRQGLPKASFVQMEVRALTVRLRPLRSEMWWVCTSNWRLCVRKMPGFARWGFGRRHHQRSSATMSRAPRQSSNRSRRRRQILRRIACCLSDVEHRTMGRASRSQWLWGGAST